MRIVTNRPADCADERFGRGRELTIENLNGKDIRVRRFLADYRGDRGAVSQSIDVVVVLTSGSVHANPAGDVPHVRMRGMDTAVGDDDTHARTGGFNLGQLQQPTSRSLRHR